MSTTPIISWPMATDYFTGSPSPVRDVSYSITGTKGSTTYFYWVVANYSWGSVAPRAPLQVTNAPDVLGVSGSVVLSWLPPSNQIVNYSVLRTTTPLFPGSSTTAVIVNTTNTTVTDSGAALVAFTFTAIQAMRGIIYIDGVGPTPVLISNIGMQVSGSLSTTGGVSTTSTTGGNVPAFRAYTITLVGTNWQITGPTGTVTTVPTAAATGQQIPLDILPTNAYITDAAISLAAGIVGGTTSAVVDGIGPSGSPSTIVAATMDLKVANNFTDTTTSVGRVVLNAPVQIFVHVTGSSNINLWTPPCSFIVSLQWAVSN